jgi:hypothetical protein
MNDKLKNIGQKILDKVPDPPEKFGSVIAILMVISIILTLIRVIQECKKDKLKLCGSESDKCVMFNTEIHNLSLNRGWFTKRTIKKLLKKELSKEEYNKYGISLMNAVLQSGTSLTEDETFTLVEAINV